MEEKVFDLLAQLYNEIKSIKANMATKDDIKRLEGALFRFENNAERKFDALFDGYSQNTEAIYELRRDIEHLKAIVEQHEVKLKIVK
ncbi:MAG TPA: hypothetical protein PLW11_08100 [Bacillota bacterium]|nr:hypothetical protein [Bacillota bacterium]